MSPGLACLPSQHLCARDAPMQGHTLTVTPLPPESPPAVQVPAAWGCSVAPSVLAGLAHGVRQAWTAPWAFSCSPAHVGLVFHGSACPEGIPAAHPAPAACVWGARPSGFVSAGTHRGLGLLFPSCMLPFRDVPTG